MFMSENGFVFSPLPATSEPVTPVRTTSATSGFPSPAADYAEDRIDLLHELVRNPTATFLARIQGNSMRRAGLRHGDLLLVDRSRDPSPGDTALVWTDGSFAAGILHATEEGWTLRTANAHTPELPLGAETELWGVVTYVIHPCGRFT